MFPDFAVVVAEPPGEIGRPSPTSRDASVPSEAGPTRLNLEIPLAHTGALLFGSGNVGLKSLVADDVSVRIAGSGDAKVTANKALGVSIAGSGDVEYSGNATAIRTSVAGSGRIVKR